MTGQELRKLATVARLSVESTCDRQLAQADLADAYVTCAADLLDKGESGTAIKLLRHAGEVCPGYAQIQPEEGRRT